MYRSVSLDISLEDDMNSSFPTGGSDRGFSDKGFGGAFGSGGGFGSGGSAQDLWNTLGQIRQGLEETFGQTIGQTFGQAFGQKVGSRVGRGDVRAAILSLLAEQPMHGYQLRTEFERRTGGTWPLNIGQVYTTLQRLERDGLAEEAERGEDGTVTYRLTDAGAAEVAEWWQTPVSRETPGRDELAIKLALAVTVPGVDVPAVVQRQRTETLRSLQSYTRLKRQSKPDGSTADLAWRLVLENLVFSAEAEVRWLDHVEATLLQARHRRGSGRRTATTTPSERRNKQVTR